MENPNNLSQALVILDENRKILKWSEKARKIFGWLDEEVEGKELLSLIFPEKPSEIDELSHKLFGSGMSYTLSQRTTEVVVRHRDGESLALEINVVPCLINQEKRVYVFIHDLATGNWANQNKRIQMAITNLLARSPRLDEVFPQILAAFCHHTAWVFGAFWKLELGGEWANCVHSENRIPGELDEFSNRTRTLVIKKGNSLPGGVWESEEMVWITDITGREFFIRAPEAKAGGLETGFGIPIKQGVRFFGAFEFYSRQSLFPDPEFLGLIHSFSEQLSEYITLKDAEETIRINEERFRAAAKYASFVPAEVDSELRYRWIFNPDPDFKPAQVIGKRDDELENTPSIMRLVELKRRVLESGAGATEEIAFERGDGMHFYDFIIEPIRNAEGIVTGVMSVAFDITNRRRTERELIKFGLLVEESTEFIALIDLNCSLLYLNRAAKRIVGIPETELERGVNVFDFITPEDRSELKEIVQRVIIQGSWQGEFRLMNKSTGKVTPVAWNIFLLREKYHSEDREGAVVAMAVLASDLTELKEKEEHLRQAHKMEALGRLAGGIAHDFNNLLTAIIGYSDMLVGSFSEGEANYDLAAEIKRAGERASSLTRQLLTYSRKQVFEKRIININDTVFSMETMLKRLIGENVTLESQTDAELRLIEMDPGHLEQIILNLVLNARDAMPSGGRLLLETHNVNLDKEALRALPSLKPGPYVVMCVTDTGEGMDSETLSHIFEPFFTTKKEGDGTGLGLSMAWGIVQQAEGAIQVESASGKGTIFRLYFPATLQKQIVKEVAPASNMASPEATETILLVEDEEVVRSFLRKGLESGGYRVLEASNGKEALEMERNFHMPIHLLVTDLVMPEMGGMELAEAIKQRHSDVRVLFVSGYTPDARIANRLKDGEIELLGKPFTAEILLESVGRLLGQGSPKGATPDSAPRP